MQEVDEFFDAVSDMMSQSFFSTASSSVLYEPSEAMHSIDEVEADNAAEESWVVSTLLVFFLQSPTATH